MTIKTWNFINWKIFGGKTSAARYCCSGTYCESGRAWTWQLFQHNWAIDEVLTLNRLWKCSNKRFFFQKKAEFSSKLVKKHVRRYFTLHRDRLYQNNNDWSFFSTCWIPDKIVSKRSTDSRPIQYHELQNPWKFVYGKPYMCFFGVAN